MGPEPWLLLLFFSAPVFGVLVYNFIVTSTILPPPRWALNHKQTSPSTPTTSALVSYCLSIYIYNLR